MGYNRRQVGPRKTNATRGSLMSDFDPNDASAAISAAGAWVNEPKGNDKAAL